MTLGLTSRGLLICLAVLAVALPAASVWVARRMQHGATLRRTASTWSVVVLAQIAAVMAVLVFVNDQYGLYATWDDLLGITPPASAAAFDPAPAATQGGTSARPVATPWVHGVPAGFTNAGNHTYLTTVHVQGTPAPLRMYVVLPPQYFEAKYAHTEFPVLELFHGYPGSPFSWLHRMDVHQHLQAAVARGGTPFVLVVPQITVAGAPDLECMDLPKQPKIETFLVHDLRQIVTTHFRVRTDRTGWGIVGYSEGGYCAAQYVLRYPGQFAAAVAIAGYPKPESTYFASLPKRYTDAGDLQLLLQKAPDVALLATESTQDRQAHGVFAALAGVTPPTVVKTVLYQTGGHNIQDFAKELGADFLWISHYLASVP